jgi:hypothetical protein
MAKNKKESKLKQIFNKKIEEYKQQAARERELRMQVQEAARKERQKQAMETARYRERKRGRDERRKISTPAKPYSPGPMFGGGDFFGSQTTSRKRKEKPRNISDFKLWE